MTDDFKISEKKLKRYFVDKYLGKLCECKNKTILVDTINRRLECSECGAPLDPFEVIEELLNYQDNFYSTIKGLKQEKEELEKWMLNNRMGQTLREIASNLRRGLLPECPHCDKPFELEKIKAWCSKEYAIYLYQKEMSTANRKGGSDDR